MAAVLARVGHSIMLVGFVLRELVVDTAALVIALLNPRHRFRPYLVEVPLRCRTEHGIAVLAMLVALSSPRQVGVELSTEPRRLTVYVLDASDAASAREDIHRLETMLLRATGSPARFEDPPEVE